jgi:hypothetical protein
METLFLTEHGRQSDQQPISASVATGHQRHREVSAALRVSAAGNFGVSISRKFISQIPPRNAGLGIEGAQ